MAVAAAVSCVAVAAGGPAVMARAAADASTEAALRAADAALHPIREGVIRVRSIVSRPGTDPVTAIVDVYVQGEEHVLCAFRDGPLAERRILTAGEKTWLLVPGSERAIPIGAGQRLLGGASIAEVTMIRFSADFEASPRPEVESLDGSPCRVTDLRARSRKSPYAAGTIWIGRDDGLPRRALLLLASGKPAKEIRFTSFGRRPSGPVIERMRIIHLLTSERGMETDLELLTLETRPLDADLFTPSGARRLS